MIVRKKIDANYTKIPNTPDDYLNDPIISAKSKGILTQLLCKPDNWRLSITYLVNTNKEGPSAIRTAINELIDYGYIHRNVVREKSGRIRGTQHIIFDHRVSPEEARTMELVRTHKYNSMPTVGDIINVMDGMVGINTEQRAEIDAGKVLDHLHYFGSQVAPSFDDPITKHLMGHRWRYHSWASRVKEDDLKWWSRDFVRAYKAHAVAANAGFYLPVNPVVRRVDHLIGESSSVELY